MRYHIQTHGCQMNWSDSERIATICEELDYKESKDMRKTDLLIFNTCSVKQKAEDKIIGHMREIECQISPR